ncbi:MAG TPA: HAD-IA family hydrolase [Candidatus Saccharimonadia bacterium]|nr:HAD-IA family hydrolase [Candidatus Saccharimonadia bacterium]
MDEVGLGKAIQLARQAKGFTQQQLCERANLSYSTLAKIERGAIKSPSIFTIQSIAETLGLELSELMGNVTSSGSRSQKRTSLSGIRFVYFDVNGCLVRYFERSFTKIAHKFSVSSEIVEDIFWKYNDAICRGDMNLEDFNGILSKAVGGDINYADFYLESVEQVPESEQLLLNVSKHYSVGIISNIMPGLMNRLIKKGLIPDISYSSIVDSSVFGLLKPEKEIFNIAEDQANVKPDEILLIDDTNSNLMAVTQLGWHVIRFNDGDPADSIERIKTALQLDMI